jgi:hypothetical protein
VSKSPGPKVPRATRRQFTRRLGLAAASLVVPIDSPAEEPEKKPADPTSVATDALAEIAKARYGKHLTDEQLKQVKQSIGRSLASGERMRRVQLKNSDEPDFRFGADVPTE